jgi:WD40 repeat protein
LYEAKSGKLLREFPRQYSQVTGIAFSPDGKYLLIGGFNMPHVITKLWDLSLPESQEPQTILRSARSLVRNYAYSPDGRMIAYGEFQRGEPVVSIQELSAKQKARTYKLQAEAESLVFSADGKELAVGTEKGQILLLPIRPHP